MPELRSLCTGVLAFFAMVSGAGAEAMQRIPVHGVTSGHSCRNKGTKDFVGMLSSSMTGAAIRHVTRAAILRWAPPGTMLTMDYRADRVTVYLDGHKKITRIIFG
ncbi:MAG TPA: I78 family peptidase inhibitor [Sphingomicrobium sp.]|nr:I78 family peptidase inhibitor [Sphingomicrobium sp.]